MAIPQKQIHTEIDYYALPEDVRAELIDGQIYYQTAPSRIHQEILVHRSTNNWTNRAECFFECAGQKMQA